MQKRILLIEDHQDINALIAMNLEVLDYHVTRCSDGAEGLHLGTTQTFDLIILDIMLPSMDGLQVCQHLRAKNIFTPILMLTAKKSESDRVVGLETGADDYLTKPFSVRELQARVKAHLRRTDMSQKESTSQADDALHFGELSIDKTKRRLTIGDKEITLTAKEFDLLLYMASHPGQVFSREKLLDAVWGYQHSGYEHTVNSHINRLRTKLETDTSNPKYVLTVWGVGYKFYD
ncbi:response regulator transcription factor [Saccharophagus degradans]|uniref:response regulator transcription factor n=1 Tax=Saccharophagus degradans TaxID=86304 RepID=UPI0024782A51|nr:response regulator transcription factor [Saccharophagus degradans]WGO98859.1 response regulator transcription factor [Saccharophagus degradans]